MIEEIWKDVVGYEECFKVSNTGKVWSKRTNKELKQTKLKSGYFVINSRIGGRDGVAISLRVHRLVAEAFLEEPSEDLKQLCAKQHHGKVIVRHIDNDKQNNSADNLQWGTCKDNSEDYFGTDESKIALKKRSGVNNSKSKLSEEDVSFIRDNYIPRDRIYGCRALAHLLGISHSRVSHIINNISYL